MVDVRTNQDYRIFINKSIFFFTHGAFIVRRNMFINNVRRIPTRFEYTEILEVIK